MEPVAAIAETLAQEAMEQLLAAGEVPGSLGLGGEPENPKPGSDGTITSKASASSPPCAAGLASATASLVISR